MPCGTWPIKMGGKTGDLTLWFDRVCIHLPGTHELIRLRSIDVFYRKGAKLDLRVGNRKYGLTMLDDPDAMWAAIKECCFPAE